jgi:hypothetical protein
MSDQNNFMPKINKNDLLKAKKYPYIFLNLFADKYKDNEGKEKPNLNISQRTLLSFMEFDMDVRGSSGFFILIYYGYGKQIFEEPFSQIINTWGAEKTGGIIERAKNIYEKNKDKLEEMKVQAKTHDEYAALCSSITNFENLEHEYICNDEIDIIKKYIETNITLFAEIDEDNTQVSYIDNNIKEKESIKRMMEDIEIFNKYIEDNKNKLGITDGKNTLVINESNIFGESGTSFSSIQTYIYGKKINIEIKKSREEKNGKKK